MPGGASAYSRSSLWKVAISRTVAAFGDVAFHGSLGASPPAQPIVAVSLSRSR
jgi:hypothetical protein